MSVLQSYYMCLRFWVLLFIMQVLMQYVEMVILAMYVKIAK